MSLPDKSERHLPGCRTLSCAEIAGGEPKPDHITDEAWARPLIQSCEDGCPEAKRTRQRAIALARKKGYLRDDGTWTWESDALSEEAT